MCVSADAVTAGVDKVVRMLGPACFTGRINAVHDAPARAASRSGLCDSLTASYASLARRSVKMSRTCTQCT